MNDVAARAQVSLKTVSRVVNGDAGVVEGTRRRVLDAISQLGFRRNDSARQLRIGRAAEIGLLVEDVGDPFYSTVTRAVERVAAANDCLLFTGSCDDDPERERKLALALCARRVDGLLIVPASADHAYLASELDSGLPVVFIDRPPVNLDTDAVLADNVGGARSAVAHLIAAGHRRIGFVGDDPDIYTARRRLLGFRQEMAAHGLDVDEAWIAVGEPGAGRLRRHAERLRDKLEQLLDGPAAVTALFTGNNRITTQVLRELALRDADAGAVLPRPALVGFDDFEFADLVTPGVTVVAQDPAALGRTAAALLFERLAGLTEPARQVVLPTRLVVRGSGELPPPA
ncbi:transcriptional regulator, LacI family [Catenulispora acidiphila DSM 44928]|uniref:Transcriptional regulator, LacI family n=2 Tax=Catenulispora TaxID=414878 RepID=C7PXN2_CATAD|nr:transcriptional regulator, LacI family [Catenulispora acidiphila DSM 44928]